MQLAYSYIRFSSEKQGLGDSLRRQIEGAERYAREHDLILDTHSYRDLGVSAFKGKNAVEGKLATFLRAIDSGLVAPHAFLLVESLDRLSRHDVDEALQLFLSIIRKGITIVTLGDSQQYSRDSIKRDHGISLIVSITIMMRAHEESATKSKRNKEAWKERAARGGILTSVCPSWLKLEDGKWKVIGSKAKVVQRIFKLAQEGYGAHTIHRILNAAQVETLRSAKFWTPGLVYSVLSSHAVYGTLERRRAGGPAITDYYPTVISRDTFDRVRLMSRSRSWKAVGPTTVNTTNLFIGRSYCTCGSRVIVTTGVPTRYLLRCKRANAEAGCEAKAIVNKAAEASLFEELLRAPPPSSEQSLQSIAAATEAKNLGVRVRQLQGERDALIRLGLATNQIRSTADQLAEIDSNLDTARLALDQARRRAATIDPYSEAAKARQICAAIVGARALDGDQGAMREKLAALTRSIFSRITFDAGLPRMTLEYATGRTFTVSYDRPEVAALPDPLPSYRPSYEEPKTSRACRLTKEAWLKRFALALQKLEPGTKWHDPFFSRCAELTYPDAIDLRPEEAAEIFASDHGVSDPGAPGA